MHVAVWQNQYYIVISLQLNKFKLKKNKKNTMAYVKYIFDYVNHSIHSFCNLYMSGSVLSARDMRANSRYSSTHRELSKFSTTFAVKD